MGVVVGWTNNVILHDKLGTDVAPYWYIIALYGLYNVCYIDFDKKGVYNQSYSKKDFFYLKS